MSVKRYEREDDDGNLITMIDIDEACEYVEGELGQYVYDSRDAMIAELMDGDEYAFASETEMLDWLFDDPSSDVIDRIEALGFVQAEDGKADANRCKVKIGKFELVARPATDGGIHIAHVDGVGNNMLTINEGGVQLYPSYAGLPKSKLAKGGFVMVEPYEGRLEEVMRAAKAEGKLDESPLRKHHATAMWNEEGVTISAQGRGVKTAPTLAEAMKDDG